MELLAGFLNVSFLANDLPDIYADDNCVWGQQTAQEKGKGEDPNVIKVLTFALPVVRCANKDAKVVQEKLKIQFRMLGLDPNKMKKNGLVFATSDGGSENLPAMKQLFGKENDDFVFVYCAAHAWSLIFTHAAGVLPGASKKKDKKNEKMTHWCVHHNHCA